MKKVICDKCGAEAEGRKVAGFLERMIDIGGPRYIDLCPECAKEFDQVRAGAARTFNATVDAWLRSVLPKEEDK